MSNTDFHDNSEEIRRLQARVHELLGTLESQAELYEDRIERLKIRNKEELDHLRIHHKEELDSLKAELKPDFAQERDDLLTSVQSTISMAIDGLRQCKISNNEYSSELETFAESKGSTASEYPLPTTPIAKQGSNPQVAAALPKDAELAATRDQPKVSTIPSFQSFASQPQTPARGSGFGSFGLPQGPGTTFNHPAKSPSQFPALGSSKPKLDVRTGEGEGQQLKQKSDNHGSDEGKQPTTQPKVHENPRAQSPKLVCTSAIGSRVYATGSQPITATLPAQNSENPLLQRSETLLKHPPMKNPAEFRKRFDAEEQLKKEAQSAKPKPVVASLPADIDKKPLSRF